MSDNQNLKVVAKGAGLMFIGIVFSKAVSFLYRILVGQALGPEQYGLVTLMMSVFSAVTLIGFLRLPDGVQKYISSYREKEGDINSVFQTGVLMVLVSSLITGSLLFYFAGSISTILFNEPRAELLVKMVAVILPLRGLHSISLSLTNAWEKMEYHVYTERVINTSLQLLLGVIFIKLGYEYRGAAAAYIIAFGVAALLSFYYAVKLQPKILKKFSISKEEGKNLLNHSAPLVAAGFFGMMLGNIDTFTLQYLDGSRSVGLYQAAYPLAFLLTMGNTMFSKISLSTLSKTFARDDEEGFKQTYNYIIKWSLLVITPPFVVMLVFPKAALTLFGSEFTGVTLTLQILAASFMITSLQGPINMVYQAVGRTRLNLVTTVILAVLNTVLNFALIPIYGVSGAAIATIISSSILFLVNMYIYKSEFNEWLIPRSSLKIALSGLIALLSVILVNNVLFSVTPYWFYPLNIVLIGCVYIFSVFRTGLIGNVEFEIIEATERKFNLERFKITETVRKFSKHQDQD